MTHYGYKYEYMLISIMSIEFQNLLNRLKSKNGRHAPGQYRLLKMTKFEMIFELLPKQNLKSSQFEFSRV